MALLKPGANPHGQDDGKGCELFMIIRSLSIQSHDNLGAAVFKLMIISVCCIQTQLIVFMPNAGTSVQREGYPQFTDPRSLLL